jgi:hypothetical protein
MAKPLSWQLGKDEVGAQVVLSGEITEATNFAELTEAVPQEATFDVGGVVRINSCGVREWMRFLADLENRGRRLRFDKCSVAFVHQLNMVSNFCGGAEIRSVYAPYVCPECDASAQKLIGLLQSPQTQLEEAVKCTECGAEMEFDDMTDQYLAFLRRAR